MCTLEHSISQNCYIYIHNSTSECEIPCKLEFCERELHHFISCPVWKCFPLTTTSPTTTTTTTSLVSTSTTFETTTGSPIKPDHPALVFSSYALNIVLIVCLVFVIVGKCKKAILKCWNRFRQRNQNNDEDDPRIPIVRNQNRRRSNQTRQSRSNQGFQPLIENNDHVFVLDDIESDEESLGFANVHLTPSTSSTPRVPSFLNTPPNATGTNDPLGNVRVNNIGMSTFAPRTIPKRSPSTRTNETFL